MDPQIQLWNQYQHLTDEIKTADAQNFQILGVVITAIVAVLNAGFANADLVTRFWMFLTAYAITFPARRLFAGNQVRIWRIATYLRVFVEPQFTDLKWQTRLFDRSRITPLTDLHGMLSSRLTGYELRIFRMLNVVTAIAVVFGTRMGPATALATSIKPWIHAPFLPVLLETLGVGAMALVTARYYLSNSRLEREIRRHGPAEEAHCATWRALRKAEAANSAD